MKKLLALLLLLFAMQVQAMTLDLPGGERSNVVVYPGEGKPYAIIYLHGKSSIPNIEPAEAMFSDLAAAGYTVYAAEMPWGRNQYRGGQDTADAIIGQLVTTITAKGKQAVLVGHSMGASYAVITAARNGGKLAGVIPIAFAHVPQVSNKIRQGTASSVSRAAELVSTGKGKQVATFTDVNQGQLYDIHATAEYYQSFYDPAIYPDATVMASQVNIPVLWISGKGDRLNDVYDHEKVFGRLPTNNKNRYVLLKGGHMGVLKFSGEAIVSWLESL